jgi:hypothetical protein
MSDSNIVRIDIRAAMAYMEEQGARMVRYRYSKTNTCDWLSEISPQTEAEKWLAFHLAHPEFQHAPASVRLHHKWSGGLSDHVRQMIGICLDIKQLYAGDWGAVSISDIIIGCYIHDFAKIWKYEKLTAEELAQLKDNEKGQEFRYKDGAFRYVTEEVKLIQELAKHGIQLTELQAGSLLFAEGGYSDAHFGFAGRTETSTTGHTTNPLAVLISIADLYSACILGGST